jgi:hypothetical protein
MLITFLAWLRAGLLITDAQAFTLLLDNFAEKLGVDVLIKLFLQLRVDRAIDV